MTEYPFDTSVMSESTVADYQQLATGFERPFSLGEHAPWHRLIYGLLSMKRRIAENGSRLSGSHSRSHRPR